MRFLPAFLDDIRNRVAISTVVGRRVAWDRRKTNAGKGDYWACCPFHNEKSPSFHVEDRKGRYHCFGCKKSGDIFTFLVEKEGLAFPEAVAQLAHEAGLAMPAFSEADAEREQQRASLYEVMELAARFFESELQTARGAKARGYLADRQLSPAIQQAFRLGYAPDDRQALRSHLAQHDILLEHMEECGLVISGPDIPVAYDRFRDRVMFPIRDARGRVIAFGGRALKADALAKYLNSPETPLFHKGSVLYNLDKARQPAHELGAIIAVEGYVDVIAMTRAGLPHTVAPLGTALTEEQLGLLWKAAAEPTLCFDGDSAGQKAAYRALDLALPLLKPGYSLKFVLLPEGKDPDDMLKSDGSDALQAAVMAAEPLSELLWQRFLSENDRSTPERKARFEQDYRQMLGRIQDETVKKHYLDDLRERLRGLWQNNLGENQAGSGKFAARPKNFWKRGQKSWEVAGAASPQLKKIATSGSFAKAQERREGMMLLCFLNHPPLLDEFLDDVAQINFVSQELDSLRTQIINSAAFGVKLERDDLKRHLSNQGFGLSISRLEDQAKRLNEWFLGSGAAIDDARTGLRHMFALHHKTITLDREVKAAEAAFIAEPTEENFKALTALREQLLSATGSEALIAGFGAASGRRVDLLG